MTRFGWVMVTYFSALLVGGSAFVHPTPRLIWNVTASTPAGLYALVPTYRPRIGDVVAVSPPEPIAGFLADGGYLPERVPLLKRVTAIAGQTVCRFGAVVTVDTIVVGAARERDSRGRALPVWRGCRVIGDGEFFLMNPHPDSLDGRYFGPLPTTMLLGRAHPLFLLPTNSGGDHANR